MYPDEKGCLCLGNVHVNHRCLSIEFSLYMLWSPQKVYIVVINRSGYRYTNVGTLKFFAERLFFSFKQYALLGAVCAWLHPRCCHCWSPPPTTLADIVRPAHQRSLRATNMGLCHSTDCRHSRCPCRRARAWPCLLHAYQGATIFQRFTKPLEVDSSFLSTGTK